MPWGFVRDTAPDVLGFARDGAPTSLGFTRDVVPAHGSSGLFDPEIFDLVIFDVSASGFTFQRDE